jgi:hypothetical protein
MARQAYRGSIKAEEIVGDRLVVELGKEGFIDRNYK